MHKKTTIFVFSLFLNFCFASTVFAKEKVYPKPKVGVAVVDGNLIKEVSSQEKKEFKLLAHRIAAREKSQYRKAYAIASYLASQFLNVYFLGGEFDGIKNGCDDIVWQRGDIKQCTLESERIMRTNILGRVEFARLFQDMCQEVGIKAGTVFGGLIYPPGEYFDNFRKISPTLFERTIVGDNGLLQTEIWQYCDIAYPPEKIKRKNQYPCLGSKNAIDMYGLRHVWNYFVADNEKIYVDVALMAKSCRLLDYKSLNYCKRLEDKYCEKAEKKTNYKRKCYFPYDSFYFDFLYEDENLSEGYRHKINTTKKKLKNPIKKQKK